jgi:hypothetical protein
MSEEFKLEIVNLPSNITENDIIYLINNIIPKTINYYFDSVNYTLSLEYNNYEDMVESYMSIDTNFIKNEVVVDNIKTFLNKNELDEEDKPFIDFNYKFNTNIEIGCNYFTKLDIIGLIFKKYTGKCLILVYNNINDNEEIMAFMPPEICIKDLKDCTQIEFFVDKLRLRIKGYVDDRSFDFKIYTKNQDYLINLLKESGLKIPDNIFDSLNYYNFNL